MRFFPHLLAFLAAPVLASCSGTTTNPCDANPNAPSCLGTCTGQCAPNAVGFAAYMVQLWSGPDGTTPPACPSATPMPGLPGYLDTPPDVTACDPPCSCGPSTGVCFQPPALTANATSCPASGAGTVINPPEQWSGACAATSTVPSADSVTVDPPGVGGAQCYPSLVTTPTIAGGTTRATWCTTFSMLPDGQCPLAANELCAFTKVPGFSVCLWGQGDIPCPAEWNDRHLYFDDADACHCSCDAVVGGSCSTTVTVFGDGACTKPLASTTVSSDQPAACTDVTLPGTALGGMAATLPTYHSGSCSPVTTKSPVSTMCCLP